MTTPETTPGTSATTTQSRMSAGTRSTLIGAIFLMATSAIGPGFITQTTAFTVELGAAFAFAILVSILVDIALQLNVWRVIGVSGMRAQELGNRVLPGLGFVMAALLLVGGFVFNVGNVAGAGLGTDAMLGLDPTIGGALSAAIAIGIFLSKKAGLAIDRVVLVLGAVMIVLTTYIAITSGPPMGDVLRGTVEIQDGTGLATTTLIGGTVGGYIVYAGAHRLLDSGVQGTDRLREITRGSVTGIIVTGVMRVILFLAILGVVTQGFELDPENQAADAFQAAAGEVGLRVFGIVLWAAAITSVIGASYTTVSFITSRTRTSDAVRTGLVVAFIALTTGIFVVAGAAPTTLLIFAGAFNGLLLPIGIGVMMFVAWFRRDLLGGYRYPKWLVSLGTAAWLVTVYLAWTSVGPVFDLF
ncbi:NRAMP family divalent metal transporter [Nocardioides sp. GXQ0305]|uniref:NRAMP family divalent metal transporter n=1 Tax=Nocardioides sp. GXQ0305 TaxID=3423912 RepID=UPI003D7ED005